MSARTDSAAGMVELERLVAARWTPEVFRRFQCVWLAAVLRLPAQDIAAALGLNVATVRRVQSEFSRTGAQAILGKGNRGGRRNQCLSPEEESSFLRSHPELFSRSGAADAGALKAAFEARIGRTVHRTTIYRLLERHGRSVAEAPPRRKGAQERRRRGGRGR